MSVSSYRTILRSSTLTGGAQAFNIVANLIKLKFVAMLAGPVGVGLLGLYVNLIQTAGSIASLGLNVAATRDIAAGQANESDADVARTRQLLFYGTLLLSLIGGVLFWLASGWIAGTLLDDRSRATDVAWLSIGVVLTVAAASQTALLTGMRMVADIARISIGSSFLGVAIGIGALRIWPDHGLIIMSIIAPAAACLLGYLYIRRLPTPARVLAEADGGEKLRPMIHGWRSMLQVGVPFMASGLLLQLSQLAIRGLVQRQLGPEALGQFQAAWSLGVTYVGFIIGAMATDYYPRLTAALADRKSAMKLVNEQIEVAILLCAPIVLGLLASAPWLIHFLYSADFGPTVDVLRWQLLGDIPKLMGWPLSMVLVASRAGKTFFVAEAALSGLFVLGVVLLLPAIGIAATGIAYLAVYSVYLPLEWILARRRIDFRWSTSVKLQAAVIILASVLVAGLGQLSDVLAAVVGAFLAIVMGIWGLSRLSSLIGASGRLMKVASLSEKAKRTVKRGK